MPGNSKFTKLFEPHNIGRVKFRNRIIKTAAETCLYNENDGYVNDDCCYFYETMAKGGAGAVYVEGPAIDPPLSKIAVKGLQLDDDKYIDSFSRLVDGIHKHDCPAFLQLLHAGPWHQSFVTELQPVASSMPPEIEFADWGFGPSRQLTKGEVEGIIEKFADAAGRAAKAGFDGVDINAGGAHLLTTFLSKYLNTRKDKYGGKLENRARIVTDIIREIKTRLGDDYPVGVVMNGVEVGYQGTFEQAVKDGQELAVMLETVGADSLQVRAYQYGYIGSLWPEQAFFPEPFEPLPKGLDWSRKGPGAFVPLADSIKQKVSIPIITVGRLDPELGEQILQEEKADFIGMCRRLFADPELPNKVAAGRLEDVAPCTACLHCLEQVRFHHPIRCRINASLGRSRQFKARPATFSKKVVVVGGGPAGMEAARTAAEKGHEVVLFIGEGKLGGLLQTAAMIKGTEIEDLVKFIRYYETQLLKLGVDVRKGKTADVAAIRTIKPDAVVIAVGGTPIEFSIPGISRMNVVISADLHKRLSFFQKFFGPDMLNLLTKIWMPVGKRVIIMGNRMQGCELAEFLVKRGRKITMVGMAEQAGEGMGSEHMTRLFKWMAEKGVVMINGVRDYSDITDKGLRFIAKDGHEQIIAADTIIPVLPLEPNPWMVTYLKDEVSEVYEIGDCREPGLIANAVADGAKIGRKL